LLTETVLGSVLTVLHFEQQWLHGSGTKTSASGSDERTTSWEKALNCSWRSWYAQIPVTNIPFHQCYQYSIII